MKWLLKQIGRKVTTNFRTEYTISCVCLLFDISRRVISFKRLEIREILGNIFFDKQDCYG